MGTQLPQKGTAPNIFGPYLLRPNGCMDQNATWYGGRPRLRRFCVRLQTAKHSTPNAPELTFLAQKSEKKFRGGARPPPRSPSPSAPTAPLAPRSYGARPRRLRHLGCPPDLLTSPPFPHTFRHVCPERKSHRAKVQGSESSRE